MRIARGYRAKLTRYERYRILMKAGEIVAARRNEIARLITLESGLCLKDTQYEVGRASDVMLFAANQALVDDGQVFSCDLTAHGKSRKVYTLKEPLLGAIVAQVESIAIAGPYEPWMTTVGHGPIRQPIMLKFT